MAERLCGVILSAGLGKRLRPITLTTPKPLVPILNVPLIRIAAEKLAREGAESLHCNSFHLKESIRNYIESAGLKIEVHEETELLGTGGGIGNMKRSLAGCSEILLHNGDILANIGYSKAIDLHRTRNPLMTLILLKDGPPLNVYCTDEGEVTSIGNPVKERDAAKRLGYSGMAILSPVALEFFPDRGKANLIDIMNEMIKKKTGNIIYYTPPLESETLWIDIGTPKNYLKVHELIIAEKKRFDPLIEPPPLAIFADRDAEIDPGARWHGFVSLQKGSRVERDTFLKDCIVMEGALVESNSSYKESIITKGNVINVEKKR